MHEACEQLYGFQKEVEVGKDQLGTPERVNDEIWRRGLMVEEGRS